MTDTCHGGQTGNPSSGMTNVRLRGTSQHNMFHRRERLGGLGIAAVGCLGSTGLSRR
jgi:hypothetical protein